MFRYTALLILVFLSLNANAQLSLVYQNNENLIANPERGFYQHTETSSASYNFLSESTLKNYRSEGYSLILRVFYLSSFLDSEISQQFLDNMQTDFNTARKSGVKIIVRFAYTKKSSAPYNDAPLERVLIHIAQLKPLFSLNSDVIAVVQAGFIGAWGEWYYTDHFAQNIGNPSEEDWNNRRALVDALLDALPESRYVQVRTPDIKMKITDRFLPVGEFDIDSGSMEARLGHHNDCFLASPNDVGTYRDTSLEKPFLAVETKYLPMGGETCGIYEPLSECENTLKQMKRFHWSYINVDYHPDVINGWREEGCFSEIENRLGYRYRLVSAEAMELSKPKGKFSLNVNLLNDGWANIYNKRPLEIVLRNTDSGKEFVLDTDIDARFWPLQDTIKLTVSGGIPSYMPTGDYQVFLNFPASEFAIKGNPDYSIQLANLSTWESSTGYNDLKYTVNIDPSNTGVENYIGEHSFVPRVDRPEEENTQIKIDGDAADWELIQADYIVESQSLRIAKSTVSNDTLFLMLGGSGLQIAHQIFINADQSSTGYSAWQWSLNGVDYLIENEMLYAFSGTDHGWGWTEVGSITKAHSAEAIEFGIPLSMLSSTALQQEFSYAHINDPSGTILYLPLQSESFINASKPYELNGPLSATVYGNEAILYWAEDTSQLNRVIERKVGEGEFEQLAVLPPHLISMKNTDLVSGQSYSYRMYLTDGSHYSSYSAPVSVLPDGVTLRYIAIHADGEVTDWDAIEPVSVIYTDKLVLLKGFQSSTSYSFLIQGESPEKYALYLNTDGDHMLGGLPGLWKNEGFDLKISHDSLYLFQSGQWNFEMKLDSFARSETCIEMQIPANQNYFKPGITSVYCGLKIESDLMEYLPLQMTATRSFPVYPASVVPDNFSVRRSGTYPESRVVIEWDANPINHAVVIERSESRSGIFEEIALLTGGEKIYRDENLDAATTYFYRIYSFNNTGRSDNSDILEVSTLDVSLPVVTSVFKVYPTLVDDHALIEFELKEQKNVRLSLHNSLGQEVLQIENSELRAGAYKYVLDSGNLANGIHVLRFVAGNETRSVVLIIK